MLVAFQEVLFMWVEQAHVSRLPICLFVSCRNHFKNQLACEWVGLVGCGFGDSFLLLLTFFMHMLLNFYLLRKYKGGKSEFCVISVCFCA